VWQPFGAAAAGMLASRLNPLWFLAGGGILGVVLL